MYLTGPFSNMPPSIFASVFIEGVGVFIAAGVGVLLVVVVVVVLEEVVAFCLQMDLPFRRIFSKLGIGLVRSNLT